MLGRFFCAIGKALGGCSQVEEKPSFLTEDYPVLETTWAEVIVSLSKTGLTAMIATSDIPDYSFFYTDAGHWKKIIKHLTYPAIFYQQEERKDCDDYSKKASADSSFYFGLNCLQAWGDSALGYHAYNLLMVAPDAWKVFEPNGSFDVSGKLLDLDNRQGWIPRKWKP